MYKLKKVRNIKYLSFVNAFDLAGTNQTSQSSDTYSDEDVNSLAKKLEELGNSLPVEQRELLQHLIEGAESLFKQGTKEEVIIVDKQIKDAAISALRPFVHSNRGKNDCYFWIRR
jgi:hypothetical protein